VKQLEIAALMENLQESKFHVNYFLIPFHYYYSQQKQEVIKYNGVLGAEAKDVLKRCKYEE